MITGGAWFLSPLAGQALLSKTRLSEYQQAALCFVLKICFIFALCSKTLKKKWLSMVKSIHDVCKVNYAACVKIKMPYNRLTAFF